MKYQNRLKYLISKTKKYYSQDKKKLIYISIGLIAVFLILLFITSTQKTNETPSATTIPTLQMENLKKVGDSTSSANFAEKAVVNYKIMKTDGALVQEITGKTVKLNNYVYENALITGINSMKVGEIKKLTVPNFHPYNYDLPEIPEDDYFIIELELIGKH